MSRDGFSTREVLQLTGTTARQLQWWDEQHIVVPERDGRRRLYSAEHLVEIHVIEELRGKGISLPATRGVLKFLRGEVGGRLSKLVSRKGEWHLLIDGKRLYLETDTKQILNLIHKATQPVVVVWLSEAARRVEFALPQQAEIIGTHDTNIIKPPARHGGVSREAGRRAG